MAHYIDKDVLVAEIERRIKEIEEIGTYLSPKGVLTNLLCHLNTFEMKEMDLEKEYEEYVIDDPILNVFIQNDVMGMKVAKHFFELGLKAQKGEEV